MAVNAVKIHKEAIEAGEARMAAKVPTPMVVQQRANPLDDDAPVVKQWVVPTGVCGFANIQVRCTTPANRAFVNGLKKAGLAGEGVEYEWAKDTYAGGYYYWVGQGGQALELKEAFAEGFVEVLRALGITAYVRARMD